MSDKPISSATAADRYNDTRTTFQRFFIPPIDPKWPTDAARYNDTTTSLTDVLSEREKRYGNFADHARITQMLKYHMRTASKWGGLKDDQTEALEMIAHKIGRILNGDPNYADSWVDIAGYAKLVADRLEKEQK